jgi:hypothetical protein
MKRRRSTARKDTLTGGTREYNPNWYKLLATQSANDTTTTTSFSLPVTRIPQSGESTIIEVLGIKYVFESSNIVNATAAFEIRSVTINLSTKNFGTGAIALNDGTLVDTQEFAFLSAFTALGSLAAHVPTTIYQPLDDGAGHGFLIATDNIYVQISSVSTTAINPVAVWLHYRFKTVDLEEYVYIVQSQQS